MVHVDDREVGARALEGRDRLGQVARQVDPEQTVVEGQLDQARDGRLVMQDERISCGWCIGCHVTLWSFLERISSAFRAGRPARS